MADVMLCSFASNWTLEPSFYLISVRRALFFSIDHAWTFFWSMHPYVSNLFERQKAISFRQRLTIVLAKNMPQIYLESDFLSTMYIYRIFFLVDKVVVQHGRPTPRPNLYRRMIYGG